MPDYGLGTLFRTKNPYEKRVKISSQIAENAGLAKPLIYATMGADMANAEQWDTERAQKTEALMGTTIQGNQTKADQEYGGKMLSAIIEKSKDDPVAATNMLDIAAQINPSLAPFKGIKFNAPTKGNWSSITDGTGQPLMVSLEGLSWMSANPDKVTPEIKARYVIPIGAPKPAADEKLPYKIGERRSYVGKDGQTYEGTFKGLDENSNPVFENSVKVAAAPMEPSLKQFVKIDRNGNVMTDGNGTPLTMSVNTKSAASIDQAKVQGFVDPGIAGLNVRTTDPQRKLLQDGTANPPAPVNAAPQGKVDWRKYLR